MGVRPETVAALTAAGISAPFPVQELTIPYLLKGMDVIGQARTGTGKTLGFAIPIVDRVVGPNDPGYANLVQPGRPQALIVTPTRELCVQVAADLATTGATRGIRSTAVYGGRAMDEQIAALKNGVEIVIGTPGRLIDLAQQGHLRLNRATILCLDEADQMLDMGFLPDVERILAMLPAERQTVLFSATMPSAIVTLARKFMTKPLHLRASEDEAEASTVDKVRQLVYRAHHLDKVEVVARILQAEDRGPTIIFNRTKHGAQRLCDDLVDRGFNVRSLHGDMSQEAREKSLNAFKAGKVDVMVATDVAARGIDVDGVTHVINYQIPENEKTYVHRIGRTGRAGKTGISVTFVDWDDMLAWSHINDALGLDFAEPVETYSSSPHLYTDLDIPAGTKGRIPGTPVIERPRTPKEDRPRDRSRDRGPHRDSRPNQGRRQDRPQKTAPNRAHTTPAATPAAAPTATAAGSPSARVRVRRRTRNGQ